MHLLLSSLLLFWIFLHSPNLLSFRELPPYHALSIAQGRLNPISMSAFDEFVDIKIPSTLKMQSHITTVCLLSLPLSSLHASLVQFHPNFAFTSFLLQTTSMQEDEVKEELLISYIEDTDVSSAVNDRGRLILHTLTDEIEAKKPILNSIASPEMNSSSSLSSANDGEFLFFYMYTHARISRWL